MKKITLLILTLKGFVVPTLLSILFSTYLDTRIYNSYVDDVDNETILLVVISFIFIPSIINFYNNKKNIVPQIKYQNLILVALSVVIFLGSITVINSLLPLEQKPRLNINELYKRLN